MIAKHIPVMSRESIENLNIKRNGIYVDCTFGSGGHSKKIIELLGSSGKLISFDCDDNVKVWKNSIVDERFIFINDNFSNLSFHLDSLKIENVDGFLFDLGLSSMQLESPRGFSYRQKSFLDMRMNLNSKLTAEKIINDFSASELADIFFLFGEERKSRKLASSIKYHCKNNRIVNSEDLVKIITGTLGKNKNKQHPARKIFQALRIKVNNELENLNIALESAFRYLSENGRIVVIAYHSLEDRLVKNIFKKYSKQNELFFLLNKRPIRPGVEEIESNRKSRSAKLRSIVRV